MDWVCQVLGSLPDWARYPAGLIIGLLVAVVIGHLVVNRFHYRQYYRIRDAWSKKGVADDLTDDAELSVDPATMGKIERAIFSVAFALYPVGILTAMGAWLALKMATHWNKARDGSDAQKTKHNSLAMLGLLSGLMSMAFAAAGGALMRLIWDWPPT